MNIQKIKKGNIHTNLKQSMSHYMLLAPFLILFTVFTVVPIAMALFVGFTNYDLLNSPQFIGFDNYINIFLEDDIFMIALKNTVILAVLVGPASYIMCFGMAWLINELGPRLRTLFTFLFYAPALSGQAYVMWTFIFSPDKYGILNGILMNLGIIKNPIAWTIDVRYMMVIVIVVQLWMSLGTGFLSFVAGLQGTDRALYEAGAIDGIRNRFQELWFITLPQLAPQLLFGAVMQIVSSFTVGDVAITLFGYPSTEYAVETMTTHIMDYGNNRFEMGYASALATMLVLMMLLANKLVNKVLARVGH